MTCAAFLALQETDRLRRRIFDMPAMADEDEPDGLAWYAFRAAVAWLYVADALSTAPTDGVINTYRCVEDVLDAAEQELGLAGVCDRLAAATVRAAKGERGALAVLAKEVQEVSARLASGSAAQ